MAYCKLGWHAQVPKTNITITLSYCHSCAAWSTFFASHTFDGDTVDIQYDVQDVAYGPFDLTTFVLDQVCDQLATEIFAPGRPWDTGRWNEADPLHYHLPPADLE